MSSGDLYCCIFVNVQLAHSLEFADNFDRHPAVHVHAVPQERVALQVLDAEVIFTGTETRNNVHTPAATSSGGKLLAKCVFACFSLPAKILHLRACEM